MSIGLLSTIVLQIILRSCTFVLVLFRRLRARKERKKLTDEPRNPENFPYESAPFVDSGHGVSRPDSRIVSLFGCWLAEQLNTTSKMNYAGIGHTQTQNGKN